MNYKNTLLVLILCVALMGCTQNEGHDMHSMPCHQMPDGSWMGDCSENPQAEAQVDQAMIEHCQHMPEMDGCAEILKQEGKTPVKRGMGMMATGEGFNAGDNDNTDSFPNAKSTTIVDLQDGDTFELSADLVMTTINGHDLTMYGYNGQIPGPALRVKKDSTITVNFQNNIDWNTTIHWHGLRHDIKDDGVPGVTQPPVQPGETYMYTVHFPDAGIYWYHPHIREDIQQDNGLAGNLLVQPLKNDFYNPVHREELLVLDDILIQNGEIVPYGKHHANYAVMGRYGNVMLTNGKTDYTLQVNKGDIVRFYITNVANVRPYQLSFDGAPMKLVGGDLGNYEQEELVDSIIISPAERYIIEVHFEQSKEYRILNKNPVSTTQLGRVLVNNKESDSAITFDTPRQYESVIEDVASFEEYFDKELDYDIELTIDMHGMDHGMMHGEAEDIEWEDDMGMMNARMTTEQVKWILKDRVTGKENMDITMNAQVGDKLKIRLWNNPKSAHPMQHPIHLHGQRFLILSVDNKSVENHVWKDTVLVPTGKTVDILVDVTNPGEWMMHCHIAEHLEAGMMAKFVVEE